MATKDFILQQFTPRTHLEAINQLLDTPDIQQVIIGVAFTNEDGVRLIEDKLRAVANRTKVFSGIRNDITSRQGLTRLMDLGVSVYVVDTGARTIVFHPKFYLAKGSEFARLVVGSANLTLPGLNNNIEASIILNLDLRSSEDSALVDNVENPLLSLPDSDPEHIWLIRSVRELKDLQASGRLLDETEALPPRPAVTAATPVEDSVSRIRLRVPLLHRTVSRARAEPVIRRTRRPGPGWRLPVQTQAATNLEIVWQSKPLTERDLNIPRARGTHRTGSINLDKGQLDERVDHRHYFRDVVFVHLQWEPRSTTVEKAETQFQLVIKGIYYGEFTLDIHHTTSTTTPTYIQHNAMTRLLWGSMREYIARRDLIGRNLSLYRDETEPRRFVLEID